VNVRHDSNVFKDPWHCGDIGKLLHGLVFDACGISPQFDTSIVKVMLTHGGNPFSLAGQ
jgi:hypothetical protein